MVTGHRVILLILAFYAMFARPGLPPYWHMQTPCAVHFYLPGMQEVLQSHGYLFDFVRANTAPALPLVVLSAGQFYYRFYLRKYLILSLTFLQAACSLAAPATPEASNPLVSSAQSMPAGSMLQTPDLGAWSKFGLKGQLNFILYLSYGNQLVRLDLSSGKLTLILQAPKDAQLNAAHISPDGKTIYFSAVSPAATGWMRLLGIRTASAHNLPSDWYRLSLTDGEHQRLTTIQEAGLAGTFSPDGTHLALISQSNLYVANPDGSGLQKLLSLTGFGTIKWVRNKR